MTDATLGKAENLPAQTRVIGLLSILTAVLLTRFSWAPSFLWTETVNLAYSLESFDPARHQPQPPGYPLFVGLARIVHQFTPSAEVTFWVISVLTTIASAVVLYRLARRMTSRWVAGAAVILLVVNPVFWFARLRSPLRPWLALFSLLLAYCAWRCWHGERRYALWGAIVLGAGVGFRPDLLAYLFPLWAMSTWVGTRSWKVMTQGLLIIGALASVWLGTIVYAMGGFQAMLQTISSYIMEQSAATPYCSLNRFACGFGQSVESSCGMELLWLVGCGRRSSPTDVPPDAIPFEVEGFRFVPE